MSKLEQLKSKVNELTQPVISQLQNQQQNKKASQDKTVASHVQMPKQEVQLHSKEKHNQAQIASKAAKQAREKADSLKKEKLAMQAQAADFGNQHQALEQKQNDSHKKEIEGVKGV